MTVSLIDEQTVPVDTRALEDLAVRTLRHRNCPEGTEVAITLVTDEAMARHRAEAMGLEGPTDVLSFPLEDLRPGTPPVAVAGGPPVLLGDLVIAPDYVRRHASELDVPFPEEMGLMVVHGLLHLLGYDHEDDADAEVMESVERELLAEVGMARR